MKNHASAVILLMTLFAAFFVSPEGQAANVSLDSCRTMAIRNNKQMRVRQGEIVKARYQKEQAKAAYLPGLDFVGGYTYNQRKLSMFDKDQSLPIQSFNTETGKYDFDLVKNPLTGEPVMAPDGTPIPSSVAYLPKKALTYDIHNVFFGAITLTQPVYMGGKIRALNKISGFAEDLAKQMRDSEGADLIYAVDAAYWQVVSLRAKEALALSYINLLDTLHKNVNAMIEQGVAVPNDLLKVEVQQNSASVDLVKVQDGLKLSRMALNQLCGLPVNDPITLVDEGGLNDVSYTIPADEYDMQEVYERRHDLQALKLGIDIRHQEAVIARAAMLPQVALVGAYSFSNPNLYDGFKKNFKGAFSVGATLTIPLWHWGANYNAYRVAQTDENIAKLQLQDAEELVDLQVNQANYRCKEAVKTHQMTVTNMVNANENLRQATLGYHEGVMTLSTVMEAQTAWLKANSEKIDAEIDVRLCNVYLAKVLGNINF